MMSRIATPLQYSFVTVSWAFSDVTDWMMSTSTACTNSLGGGGGGGGTRLIVSRSQTRDRKVLQQCDCCVRSYM